MTILDEIIDHKRRVELPQLPPVDRAALADLPPCLGFRAALQRRDDGPIRVIAESKKVQERTWYETGVRNGKQITVIRQGPSGGTRHTWATPPEGYLSQVQLYLLAPLLPRKETDEWGFYAY